MDDPIYQEVVAFAKTKRTVMIIEIQRKFRITYCGAAHLMDRMERDGIVSPFSLEVCGRVVLQEKGGE